MRVPCYGYIIYAVSLLVVEDIGEYSVYLPIADQIRSNYEKYFLYIWKESLYNMKTATEKIVNNTLTRRVAYGIQQRGRLV